MKMAVSTENILKELTKNYEVNLNLRLELDYNKKNKPVARLYQPTPKAKYTNEKQLFGFYFDNEDRRIEFLNNDYKKRIERKQYNEDYKKNKKIKNEKEALEIKIGDVFKDLIWLH